MGIPKKHKLQFIWEGWWLHYCRGVIAFLRWQIQKSQFTPKTQSTAAKVTECALSIAHGTFCGTTPSQQSSLGEGRRYWRCFAISPFQEVFELHHRKKQWCLGCRPNELPEFWILPLFQLIHGTYPVRHRFGWSQFKFDDSSLCSRQVNSSPADDVNTSRELFFPNQVNEGQWGSTCII